MIRKDDFDIEIGESERGVFVRVIHKPTGNERVADPANRHQVGKIRDRFISELRAMLYHPDDIRVDVGLTEGGDFLRVVHLPTGIERSAMRREGRTEEDLLDEVLEELLGGNFDAESGQ